LWLGALVAELLQIVYFGAVSFVFWFIGKTVFALHGTANINYG
jgi:hypothetical protein